MRLIRSASAVSAILVAAVFAYGQKEPGTPAEPVLQPLTASEQKLNPKEIVASQPDFAATEHYFSAREISGFSAASKVARKGTKYRTDTGVVVVITEPGKPTLRLNQNKTYEEGVGNHSLRLSPTSALNPSDLLMNDEVTFTALGAIEVEGRRLLKLEAAIKDFPGQVFLYADLGRRNLITIVQVITPRRSGIQRLLDVTFDVPGNLFDLSGYRMLPKFKWKKVTTAKITFEGKPAPEALAYRSGNILFIHAGEFDHLVIDLDRKAAETVAYRGSLLSKDGYYIWSTKEEEATSIGDPTDLIREKSDWYVRITTTANSATVPDRDKKGTTRLHIEW